MSVYLITGSGKGIGFEIVKALLNSGHEVHATSRNTEKLSKLETEGLLKVYSFDLTNLQDLNELIESLPNLDGVVNNAGLLHVAKFEDSTDEQWQQQWDVNVLGPVRLLRGLKVHGKLNANSHIVNISSMGGLQGSSKFPGLAAYSATKGALSILSESLATEWAKDSISVNALCLGAVQTQMLGQAFPGFEAPTTAEEMGQYIAHFLTNSGKLISGKVLAIAGQDPA